MKNLDDYRQWELNTIIEEAAKANNVDADLIRAMIKIESNNNPNAVSHKGATGYMQLMPTTAEELKINRFNKVENIFGGTQYIAKQINRFNNVDLGLAAYNAGPGAVKEHGGIPPYRETKNYVNLVKKAYNKNADNTDLENFIKRTRAEEQAKLTESPVDPVVKEGNEKQASSIWHRIGQIPRGVAHAIGSFADLPIDAVFNVTQALGIDSKWIKPGIWADLLTVDELAPKDEIDRVIHRASEAVGDELVMWALMFLTGGAAAGFKAGSLSDDALRLQRLNKEGYVLGKEVYKGVTKKFLTSVDDLTKMMKANPKKFLMLETALATHGGIHAGIYEEIWPENKAIAGMVGELVGSLGPAAVLDITKRVLKGGHALFPTKANIQARAGQVIDEAESGLPMFDEQAELSGAIAKQVGLDEAGIPLTKGQQTGEPGLISLERTQAKGAPEFGAKIKEQQRLANQVLEEYRADLAGELGPEDVSVVKRPIEEEMIQRQLVEEKRLGIKRREFDVATRNLNRHIDKVTKGFEDFAAKLPADKKGEAGRSLRLKQEKSIVDFSKQSENLYAQVDESIIYDVTELRKEAAKILGGKRKAAKLKKDIPDSLEILTDDFTDAEPLGELITLRTRLLDEGRTARSGKTPNRILAKNLDDLRTMVDDLINTVPEGTDPLIVKAWREANEEYAAGLARLKKGFAGRVVEVTPQGTYALPESEVMKQYIKADDDRGRKEALEQLLKNWTPDEIKDEVRDFAMSDIIAAMNKDGKINSKRAGMWLNQYKHVLKSFPDLRKEITNFKRMADEAMVEASEAGKKVKDIEKRAANLYAQKDARVQKINKEYGILDYEEHNFVSRIMDSANPQATFNKLWKQTAGDETAQNGIRRLFWEHIFEKSKRGATDFDDVPLTDGKKITKLMRSRKYKPIIEMMYEEKHLMGIDAIAEANKIISRTEKSAFPAGSDTFENIATELRSLIMKKYGRQVPMATKYVTAEGVLRWLYNSQVKQSTELVQNALFNPKLSDSLVKLYKLRDKLPLNLRRKIRKVPIDEPLPQELLDQFPDSFVQAHQAAVKRLRGHIYLTDYFQYEGGYEREPDFAETMMDMDRYRDYLGSDEERF